MRRYHGGDRHLKDLLAEGTVEDKVAKLLESKRVLADAVVGSGEAALTELSDDDLAELVALGRQS